MSARGNGFGLLQLSYRFHLNDSDNESVFALAPRLMENSNPAKVALEVCVIYNPRDIVDTESNMVVLEVSLPSGFATDTESTYALSKLDYVKRVETKNEMTVFVLYFDHLTANKSICPTFDAFRRKKVAEQKPVPVLVYDYYDSCKYSEVAKDDFRCNPNSTSTYTFSFSSSTRSSILHDASDHFVRHLRRRRLSAIVHQRRYQT